MRNLTVLLATGALTGTLFLAGCQPPDEDDATDEASSSSSGSLPFSKTMRSGREKLPTIFLTSAHFCASATPLSFDTISTLFMRTKTSLVSTPFSFATPFDAVTMILPFR